jgi:hypothetical protein
MRSWTILPMGMRGATLGSAPGAFGLTLRWVPSGGLGIQKCYTNSKASTQCGTAVIKHGREPEAWSLYQVKKTYNENEPCAGHQQLSREPDASVPMLSASYPACSPTAQRSPLVVFEIHILQHRVKCAKPFRMAVPEPVRTSSR